MKRSIDVPQDQKYLIAVSGGPDSMALLDMAYRQGLYIEAAHVNYHRRETADRDEKLVRKYCRDHHIPFHKKDYEDNKKGNFQANARLFRYEYFAQLVSKHHLQAVLIGHQLDDLVETYLMQQEKQLGVKYLGLAKENTINGVKVIRPLLKYEKKQLQAYCDKHNVPYGIDESNLSDHYRRNAIRHGQGQALSKAQKKQIYAECSRYNRQKDHDLKQAERFYASSRREVNDFLDNEYLLTYLREHFSHKSDTYFTEMLRQLSEAKNVIFKGDDVLIVKEYGMISTYDKPEAYSYVINSLDEIKPYRNRYFALAKKGGPLEGASIANADLPVTIRNARKGDEITMCFGRKKLNRYFIDRKKLYHERLSWPVVVNGKGEIILVPGLGCNIDHYAEKRNIFVIKL